MTKSAACRVRIAFVPPLPGGAQWVLMVLAAGTLTALWVYAWLFYKVQDWLLLSGLAALLVAVALVQAIPQALEHMLLRLAQRRVIAVNPQRLRRFVADFEQCSVRPWAIAVGSFGALAIAAAFFMAFTWEQLQQRWLLMAAEMIGGYVAGCYLGRMACYGMLRRTLHRQGIEIRPIPGHGDGASGCKPIGDFFFFQAMVVGIPAVFLAVWLLLIPLPGIYPRYHHWQDAYLTLLFFAIILELVAFFVPLWSFHTDMRRHKRALQLQADAMAPEIAAIDRQLIELDSDAARDALQARRTAMRDHADIVEASSVWPVGRRTRRLFGLNTVALLIPLLGQYLGLSEHWAAFLTGTLGSIGN